MDSNLENIQELLEILQNIIEDGNCINYLFVINQICLSIEQESNNYQSKKLQKYYNESNK